MAIVEGIPGIRRLSTPRFEPIPATEVSRQLIVSRLTPANVPQFKEVISRGIQQLPEFSASQKQAAIERRTDEYYQKRMDNPDEFTVLVAKDVAGNIVGGLEGEQFEVDGHKIGFVGWISVDPYIRKSGIATELYRSYEQQLIQDGDKDFLMANVHHVNVPSLKFHQKVGLSRVYLRKSPELGTNWYVKPLRQFGEVATPVIETDYLPDALVYAVKAAQEAMAKEGLGVVEVIDLNKQNDKAETLYSVLCANDKTRETLVRLVESIQAILAVHQYQEEPGTAEQIGKQIATTAQNMKVIGTF